MELLFTILNLITFIVVGYILKRIKLFSNRTAQELNSYVFKIAFPLNVIMSFYGVDLKEVINLSFILYISLTFLITFIFAKFVARILHTNPLTRAVSTVAIYRGNFIIMGFPILESLFGSSALIYAGIIVAVSQVFYNITTAWLYERASLGKVAFKKLFINVLKTPMLIGVFLGIIINLLGINLLFLEKPLTTIGKTASPFGLIVLGHGFIFTYNKNNIKNTLVIAFSKLICLPAIAFLTTELFNLTTLEKSISIILFGCPTAIVSYTFAKNHKADTELAQDYVVYTTILYALTIYLVLLVL